MDTKTQAAVDAIEVDRIKADIRKAEDNVKRVMEERKQSPDTYVFGRIFADEAMDKMAKRLVPKCATDPRAKRDGKNIRPGATWATAWFKAEEHAAKVDAGYIPVVESDGRHARFREMLLYKRPVELMRDEIVATRNMSKQRFSHTGAVSKEVKSAQRGGGGEIQEDSLTVTEKKLTA